MNVNRSWLIPILSNHIIGSKISLFHTRILSCAKHCESVAKQSDLPAQALYQTHSRMLWSLFTAFCNQAIDTSISFPQIARFSIALGFSIDTISNQMIKKKNYILFYFYIYFIFILQHFSCSLTKCFNTQNYCLSRNLYFD